MHRLGVLPICRIRSLRVVMREACPRIWPLLPNDYSETTPATRDFRSGPDQLHARQPAGVRSRRTASAESRL